MVVLVALIAGAAAAGIALTSSPLGRGTVSVSPSSSTTAEPAPTTTLGPPTIIDNRLFVVGDSVMQGAAPYLQDEAPAWSITSDTRVGRFLNEGARIVKRKRSQIGQVVVVGLGNNYGGDRQQFVAEVDEMLEELEGVKHILWLTVAEFRDDRRDVNATLRAAKRRDPRIVLVDWTSMWRADESLTNSDRLHLSAAGAKAMAKLIGESINAVLRSTNQLPSPNAQPPKITEGGSIPDSPPATRRVPRSTTTSVEPVLETSSTVPSDTSVPATVTAPSTTPSTPTSAAPAATVPPPTDAPTTSSG